MEYGAVSSPTYLELCRYSGIGQGKNEAEAGGGEKGTYTKHLIPFGVTILASISSFGKCTQPQ